MATNSTLLQKLIALYMAQGGGSIPFYQADSGVVTVATNATSTSCVCTFGAGGSGAAPPAGGLTNGRWMLQVSGVGTQATIQTVNVTISDGTSTETVAVIPAPTAAVTTRGATYDGWFASTLTNITNIATLTVSVSVTGTSLTTTAFEAVALGSP